ncbi:MAG: IMP dehydrogenase [Candidatus Micrarchaeota archaeon]
MELQIQTSAIAGKIIGEAFTFDDVLLVPQRSTIASRMDVDTSTHLTKTIELEVPLVSANMDSVTESAMAIALAQEGGFGIIHRNLTIQREVQEIEKVKRSENTIIERPFTVRPDDTIERAMAIREEHKVSGLVVVDEKRKVVGMLTNRDLTFETGGKMVSDVMTRDFVSAPYGSTSEEQIEIMRKNKVEKLPLIDTQGVLRGLVTARDVLRKQHYPNANRDKKGRLRCGASIGIRGDYKERTEAIMAAEPDVIAVDVAHGHMEHVAEIVTWLKKEYGCEVIAGNVATAGGARDLIAAGADCIKVGVGPGSICTTRLVAGTGVPQLTAVLNCASEAHKSEVPVIADGGMRTSGDLVKALAAGASCGMFGQMFGGTDESPGRIVSRNGKRYKMYHGMASWTALQGLKDSDRIPEGVESMVPYRGSAKEIIAHLIGGLRSGMSYSNAHTIKELWQNAQFVRITNAGLRESHSHDVDVI